METSLVRWSEGSACVVCLVSGVTALNDLALSNETRDSLLRAISLVHIFAPYAHGWCAFIPNAHRAITSAQGIAWVRPAESSSASFLPPPLRSMRSPRVTPPPALPMIRLHRCRCWARLRHTAIRSRLALSHRRLAVVVSRVVRSVVLHLSTPHGMAGTFGPKRKTRPMMPAVRNLHFIAPAFS